MNAALVSFAVEIRELEVEIPEPALRRLLLCLGRARATGEAWDACIQYGASLPTVERLLDYWCDELDFRAVEARLNALPLFGLRSADGELCFVHARSHDAAALPLLWLHGYSGSIAESLRVVDALTKPTAPDHVALHVVCPALPGFAPAEPQHEGTLAHVAATYARLMAALGYARYAVHGSGLGASIAAELGRLEPERVVALHVTSLAAMPEDEHFELASLSSDEKSRLANLRELHTTWHHASPRTAVEQLALAACQLDTDSEPSLVELGPELLWGLSYEFLRSDQEARAALERQSSTPLRSRSEVPSCVCSFPLGRPSLRRFAEREQRIVAWHEQERGGELAALERPDVLLESVRRCCAAFR